MSYEVFSQDWSQSFAEELNGSDAYREAAATWEGSLALVMTGESDDARAVFLDLWHGECRSAQPATQEDRESADFVIVASTEDWQKVLAGSLDPIFAIMSGKLALERGSLGALVPQVNAAKELVAAAARIDTTFPT